MKNIFKKIKDLINRDEISLHPKPVDLRNALHEAELNQPPPEPLTEAELFAGLQFKWKQTYSTDPPNDMETLRRVIPSGLNLKDKEQFLRGAAGEAKYLYMNLLNQSFSKEEAHQKFKEAGVENALIAWKPQEQESMKTVYKFLPDGGENATNKEEDYYEKSCPQ